MEGSQKRQTLETLFRELVIPLADPYLATQRALRWDEDAEAITVPDKSFPLSETDSIYLVGAGKAGVPMARAVVDVLQQDPRLWAKFQGGSVNVYREQATEQILRVKLFPADHPNPNQASVEGARVALDLMSKTTAGDLVVAVISGGGSSLLTLPAIDLRDFRLTNEVLVTGGASIREINTVRKHLSRVKGGKLRMAAPEADSLTLILSDVIGDDLSSIASGPTVPDFSTFGDAIQVLREYRLWDKIPAQARDYLRRGSEGQEEETLKGRLWEERLAAHSSSYLVASNSVLLQALQRELGSPAYREMGYVELDSAPVTGKVEEAVEQHFQQARGLWEQARGDGVPRTLLCGGEPIVKVPQDAQGRGGRSQHYALLSAQRIAGYPWAVLSAGTDGIDGNSPAAGAIVDGDTATLAKHKGLSPERFLADFDSHAFFKEMEARCGQSFLVESGPTGTNVNDIMLWWITPA